MSEEELFDILQHDLKDLTAFVSEITKFLATTQDNRDNHETD